MTDFTHALGDRLRAVRAQRGLSLPAVEERSGGRWKAIVVGSYERGDRAISVVGLQSLAEFYGVPATELLPDADRPRRQIADVALELDLVRVAALRADQARPLARFVATIRRQRGQEGPPTGPRWLAVRADDLSTLALVYDVALPELVDRLIDWGVLAAPRMRRSAQDRSRTQAAVAAAAAVAEAMAIAREAQALVNAELEADALVAAAAAAAQVHAAAVRTAHAAVAARHARTVATLLAADAAAAAAGDAADAVWQLADPASRATPGATSTAAALVARAVAVAAEQAAALALSADLVVEDDVARAAATVRSAADTAARTVLADATARAARETARLA